MPKKYIDSFGMYEKKCAKCGKNFISAPEHVYKTNRKWYCSWTCYNHRNDEGKIKDGGKQQTKRRTI